jgi:SAM-dependent methyltransferase
MEESLVNPREIWDGRFARWAQSSPRLPQDRSALDESYEPWLERWMPLLKTTGMTPVLDLGCGSGGDACYVASHGLPVLAADFSRQALHLTEQITHDSCAHAVELDIRDGLPFQREAFQIIIANLSLHYHRWPQTNRVLESVRLRLKAGGCLIARFNSTRDVNYGAQGHQEIEQHCYVVDGVLKRFFSQDDFHALFQNGWHIRSLEEQEVHCYQKPKTVWEIVAQRELAEPDLTSDVVARLSRAGVASDV